MTTAVDNFISVLSRLSTSFNFVKSFKPEISKEGGFLIGCQDVRQTSMTVLMSMSQLLSRPQHAWVNTDDSMPFSVNCFWYLYFFVYTLFNDKNNKTDIMLIRSDPTNMFFSFLRYHTVINFTFSSFSVCCRFVSIAVDPLKSALAEGVDGALGTNCHS